jgi:hypothetical protein
MKEALYPNTINDCLNQVWNKATDEDCMVWCDFISGDVACLTWHQYNNQCITAKYLSDVVYIVFTNFEDINHISTPSFDITRSDFNKRVANYKETNNKEYQLNL